MRHREDGSERRVLSHCDERDRDGGGTRVGQVAVCNEKAIAVAPLKVPDRRKALKIIIKENRVLIAH